jgi:hypothetical protein
VVIAVLLVVVGLVITGPTTTNSRASYNRPEHGQQLCYHHAPNVKPGADIAVVELLIMGVRTPKSFWLYINVKIINWRNSCI